MLKPRSFKVDSLLFRQFQRSFRSTGLHVGCEWHLAPKHHDENQ